MTSAFKDGTGGCSGWSASPRFGRCGEKKIEKN